MSPHKRRRSLSPRNLSLETSPENTMGPLPKIKKTDTTKLNQDLNTTTTSLEEFFQNLTSPGSLPSSPLEEPESLAASPCITPSLLDCPSPSDASSVSPCSAALPSPADPVQPSDVRLLQRFCLRLADSITLLTSSVEALEGKMKSLSESVAASYSCRTFRHALGPSRMDSHPSVQLTPLVNLQLLATNLCLNLAHPHFNKYDWINRKTILDTLRLLSNSHILNNELLSVEWLPSTSHHKRLILKFSSSKTPSLLCGLRNHLTQFGIFPQRCFINTHLSPLGRKLTNVDVCRQTGTECKDLHMEPSSPLRASTSSPINPLMTQHHQEDGLRTRNVAPSDQPSSTIDPKGPSGPGSPSLTSCSPPAPGTSPFKTPHTQSLQPAGPTLQTPRAPPLSPSIIITKPHNGCITFDDINTIQLSPPTVPPVRHQSHCRDQGDNPSSNLASHQNSSRSNNDPKNKQGKQGKITEFFGLTVSRSPHQPPVASK